jgi:hypothetical protein
MTKKHSGEKMSSTWRILVLIGLLAALPLVAWADGNDEQERNRKLLEKAKSDPQHYARLIQDLQAFLALPEERQLDMRKLDRDLHDENSANYGRLQRVLERYNAWLQRLPEAERKKLESTTDRKERLALIKEMRDREWASRLPRARQEELVKLAGDPEKYRQRVKELREEERQRRKEWAYVIRNGKDVEPTRQLLLKLQKLKPEIEEFVQESLSPLLSEPEKQRLKNEAETAKKSGSWLPFFTTFVELSEAHPLRLPPSPTIGPRTFSELPKELQARLSKRDNWPTEEARRAEGRWPGYALTVVQFVANNKVQGTPHPLGPSRPTEFSKKVQDFYKQTLLPVLDEEDAKMIRSAEGHWPRFPNQLLRLAAKHKLQVPGMVLPGEPGLWAPVRHYVQTSVRVSSAPPPRTLESLPDVPNSTLLDFVQRELSPEQQAQLPSMLLTDPEVREQIKQEFFLRNPDILERLQKADLKKQSKKAKAAKK